MGVWVAPAVWLQWRRLFGKLNFTSHHFTFPVTADEHTLGYIHRDGDKKQQLTDKTMRLEQWMTFEYNRGLRRWHRTHYQYLRSQHYLGKDLRHAININMRTVIFLLLSISFAAVSVTAIDNCDISPETLLATGNTCIDLSLCPVIGGPPPICPFVYFPACGKQRLEIKNLLANDRVTVRRFLGTVILSNHVLSFQQKIRMWRWDLHKFVLRSNERREHFHLGRMRHPSS